MNHKASVAELLGSAAGAAEALQECGIHTDDNELVARFIESMDNAHGLFVQMAQKAVAPEDLHECVRLSMVASPAGTNAMFLWRLACVLRTMASREVVEAAREVVGLANNPGVAAGDNGSISWGRAIAQLAAALPKEAE